MDNLYGINMDSITLEDCIELQKYRDTYIKINDGHIASLVEE
jgi:hypothetical protein